MRYERLLFWAALFIGLVIIGREALGKFEAEVGNSLSEKVAGEIKGTTAIGQTFVAPYPNLHRIDVFLATYARNNTHDVTFHLKASPESEEDIFAISFNASEVEDNAYRSFVFPQIRESAGKSFYFYLESPSSTPGDAITVWMSNSDAYPEGSAHIDGKPVRGDLRFLTYYSPGYLDKANLLLDRLAENKPYILGDKRFYILLGVVYLLLLVLFLNRVVEFALDGGFRIGRGVGIGAKNPTNRILLLLLSLALVRGVIYAAVIPPWQAPDETMHFEYTRLLYEKQRLLTPKDVSLSLHQEIVASMYESNYWHYVHHSPPKTMPKSIYETETYAAGTTLYRFSLAYLFGALFYAPLFYQEIVTQLYAMRLLSVFLNILVIWIAFLTAKELFPSAHFLMIAVPAWIMFLPQHTQMMAAVSDGNLAELFTSITFFILIKCFKHGLSVLKAVALSCLIVGGVLTKKTTYFILPTVVFSMLIYLIGWIKAPKRKGAVLFSLLIMACFGVSIWHLPPLGKEFKNIPSYIDSLIDSQRYTPEMLKIYLNYHLRTTFNTFWACFGWWALFWDPIWYRVVWVTALSAIAGLIFTSLRAVIRRRKMAPWRKGALLSFLLGITLSVFFLAAYNIHIRTPHIQGRYLYPAIVPIATLFILGLRQLMPFKCRPFFLLILIGSFFLLDAISLLYYIIPYFYPAFRTLT